MTATSLAGRSPYDRLRETLIGQDALPGMLEGTDEMFRQVAAMVRNASLNDLTLRALGEAHYDVTVIMGQP